MIIPVFLYENQIYLDSFVALFIDVIQVSYGVIFAASFAAAGHTLNQGDAIILLVSGGKAIGVAPYSEATLVEASQLADGAKLKIFRAETVSLDGKGPIYRNVTKEYAPQIAKVRGKNFAAAAGKEGVGGEYTTLIEAAVGEIAGQSSTKPYAKSRPPYGATQEQDVWNAHADPNTGSVVDPSGEEFYWDRTRPRNGQWDMGHIPGQKYSEKHRAYMNGDMSLEEFLSWYRDPENYRPELPKTNRSHKYE